ncbi:MAG: DUF2236 domain-containing protein [Flammeovirgaceae bacterium]|nr:DUF2236 domain-containing protein [Flammeovirgaceae bacterium]
MTTEYFVDKHSIMRQIWGRGDTILFIFAGASAEFALNKAVDWLYFTGRLPADPLGRLFSTVKYSQAIMFSEKQHALRTIDSMASIHAQVEAKRGTTIPDWAYRDVLFLLIDYSIRAFELLERKLNSAEKNEVFEVFNKVGNRMGLSGLPTSFNAWTIMRQQHLMQNLQQSNYTTDLYAQYKKHLGAVRYKILLQSQSLVTPPRVRALLHLNRTSLFQGVIVLYKVSKRLKIDWLLRALILPANYKKEIEALDRIVS